MKSTLTIYKTTTSSVISFYLDGIFARPSFINNYGSDVLLKTINGKQHCVTACPIFRVPRKTVFSLCNNIRTYA